MKRKILLVTSKIPETKDSSDGGFSTVSSLLENLKGSYNIDCLFFSEGHDNIKLDGVDKIYLRPQPFYSENKFERRVKNSKFVFNELNKFVSFYDVIIVVHVSKMFGIEKIDLRQRKKFILYPMLLSCEYINSGEIVPEDYINLEKKALNSIKWIICPSKYDKQEILKNNNTINENDIFVIPRSADSQIIHAKRDKINNYNLLSIGNIKTRKQPLLLLEIVKELKKEIPLIKLNIAGEIQDKVLYSKCKTYVKENDLIDNVCFIGAVNQTKLASLISSSTINVTTTNLETFGRCVFEGMYGGLPTLAFNNVSCLKEYVNNNNGILFCNNLSDFCKNIKELLNDANYYCKQSEYAISATDFFTRENESKKTRNAINYIIKHNEFS